MFSIHLIRPAQALLLGAILAILAVPATALGGNGTPAGLDVIERYAAVHPYGSGVGDQGPVPDWFERTAAAQNPFATLDGRSADTLDAVYAAQNEVQVVDGRSADTRDAAETPRPVTLVQPGGFDWSDAGIGAGFATGLLTLFAGSLLVWLRRHERQRIQAT